jgi:hypothetical protein
LTHGGDGGVTAAPTGYRHRSVTLPEPHPFRASTAGEARVETRVPIPAPVLAATARMFGAVAARRRNGRALHPRGVTFAGNARLTERGVSLAGGEREPGVVVRFSRGAGLPSPWPDFDGVAIRFPDAFGAGRHHDLLLTSAGRGVLRRVLRPNVDFARAHFSSIARYRLDGEPVTFLASVGGSGLPLDRLATSPPLPLVLDVAAAGGLLASRPPVPLAAITLERVVDDTIRFDPSNSAPHVVPLGWLNAMRPPAYAVSRAHADRP